MPRLINPAAADVAVGGGITTSGLYNDYRTLLWAYPAGINWGSQSWRVTTKHVSLQPGNYSRTGMFWMPKNYPHLAKNVNGWTVSQAVDTGGIVAATNNDIADARNLFSRCLFIEYGSGIGGSAGNYIVPYVGFNHVSDYLSTISSIPRNAGVSYHPAFPNNTSTPFNQHGVTFNTTQATNNGTLANKCIAYTVVTEWNATAKVMTVTTTADSNDTFKIVNGDSSPASVSTKTAAGEIVKEQLDNMSTDFWFSHGTNSGYFNTSTSNWLDALTSIKIETL